MSPLVFWSNPQTIHAISVHFPIALGVLGIPLVFICAVIQMRNGTLRWLAFTCYAAAAALASAAVITGEGAVGVLQPNLAPEVRSVVDTHALFGQNVRILALVTALLIVLCGVKSEKLRMTFIVLAVLASVATGIGMGIAGAYGAALVYQHGLGVPKAAVVTPAAPRVPRPVQMPGQELQMPGQSIPTLPQGTVRNRETPVPPGRLPYAQRGGLVPARCLERDMTMGGNVAHAH